LAVNQPKANLKRDATIKALFNGVTIAESDQTIVVENNHYFPADSVDSQYLQPSDKTTVCGWKGTANYHSVVVNNKVARDAAWYYAEPKPKAAEIKNHLAFWGAVKVTG